MSDVKDQALGPGDFTRFFQEVHDHEPFPWQEELLSRVLDRGWPAIIDVPTGLGKTAVLDVAVFLSALRSEHARRRVFLVVDRRIIVDQAYDEAERLRKALDNPTPGSVCARIRVLLAAPGGEEGPALDVTRMRGGVDWSWLWIERPDRHAIVTGTVDQVGSRLLFRGYGVGERLRPIDAAMVGTDSLIVIDEAHLSDPFFSTLRDVLTMDGGSVGRSPVMVAMSASPESGEDDAHGITNADAEHPVAGKRLRAPKSLHPVAVTAPASAAPQAVADALAYWAKQLGGQGKAIGIVANTVQMARNVFERLRAQADDPNACVLLTGRVRPIDREYLLDSWYPKIKSDADRDTDAEVYVVATQTIEAGADIDLDGMVTQSAALPALVQRLGRVNRLGRRDEAHVVVVHAEKLADRVYGAATAETWAWLASLASPVAHKAGRSEQDLGPGLGASPAALRALVGGILRSRQALMRAEKRYVPMISRSTLDSWARTSPTPHPDVPVAPYLHGIDAGEPTVFLVWRADLPGTHPRNWAHSVEVIPPTSDEAIELPISTVRRWLGQLPMGVPSAAGWAARGVSDADTSDLESQTPVDAEDVTEPEVSGPRVLCYRSTDDSEPATAQQIRPGDFVIVPSEWGGCDRYGWYPRSVAPVTDLADFTGWRDRRTAAARIGPVLVDAIKALAPELLEQTGDFVTRLKDDIATETLEGDREYREYLRRMIEGNEPRLPHERVLHRLAERGRLTEFDRDGQDGDGSAGIAGLFAAPATSWNDDQSAAGSSASPKRLTLTSHQAAVGLRAREFADNLGLPEEAARAVQCAALLHDEGKRDRRFQAMLHGGDALRARVAPEFLAKSGMDPADRAAFRRAARLSGYPPGMRHEALSARIAGAMLDQAADVKIDKDLVVHLVAAHHGCGRPLLPAIVDERPGKVEVLLGGGQTVVFDTAETVDWTGPERFGKLCEQYGRWGLALLESIVRLADIWCSARSEGCDDQG